MQVSRLQIHSENLPREAATYEREEELMKIQKITWRNRRDFSAIYECEGCGATETAEGYDDRYFHDEVIPRMRCSSCGKTSAECGADYRPLTTKYPDGMVV